MPWILGALVVISFTFLIVLQSSNLWKNLAIETSEDLVLLYALSSLNFIAFVVFAFIFLRSIFKLIRERRTLELGAQIKTRLLLYFFAVSLLPIIAMAVFSYLFMNRALDRWFTQIPVNVIQEARAMKDQSIIDRSVKLEEAAKMLASILEGRDNRAEDLGKIAGAGHLSHIEIMSADNKPLVVSERSVTAEQEAELESILASVRNGKFNEPVLHDGKGFDVATAPMSGGRLLIIVPDPFGENTVSQIVDTSLGKFDQLMQKQLTIRRVGLLTLGVLTFLLIFASTWIAFYIARGLTEPIKALAEGAGEIAKGNLAHRIHVFAEDELALLVSAFNEMSSTLEANSAELNERQKYIETVLETLPNGVISFDTGYRVGTINRSAIKILKLEDADFAGVGLDRLVNDENRAVLERLLARAVRIGQASEQNTLKREPADGNGEVNSDLPVALAATSLPNGTGVVLVIEDLSELITAQRASAWQEVARRMAHEIKNPLTPIQLSAERIAKRFADMGKETNGVSDNPRISPLTTNAIHSTDEQTLGVIREGTTTILREVNSLKSMVDEFSRFARLPKVSPQPGNLNEVISQVLSLYVGRFADITIGHDLSADLPETLIDAEQIKRVFVNLIQNAIESFDGSSDAKTISVKTRRDATRDLIVCEIADNGPGIAPIDLQKLFQPYFSTKGRGTGLGLAIVHRIISEHRGKIKVVGNQPNGAKFIIELPIGG